jgi:hypothetical protein
MEDAAVGHKGQAEFGRVTLSRSSRAMVQLTFDTFINLLLGYNKYGHTVEKK